MRMFSSLSLSIFPMCCGFQLCLILLISDRPLVHYEYICILWNKEFCTITPTAPLCIYTQAVQTVPLLHTQAIL